MNGNLEAKILERIKQANNSGISAKSNKIAERLGTLRRYEEHDIYRFKGCDLAITSRLNYHPYHFFRTSINTIVKYQGKTVFSEIGSQVIAYIPGSWGIIFETLYSESLHQQSYKPRQQSKKRDERYLKRKWGL